MVFEVEQVRITRDDEIGLGGECAGDHGIVVDIGRHHARDLRGDHELREHRVALHQKRWARVICGDHGRKMRAREDFGQFIEQHAAGVEC